MDIDQIERLVDLVARANVSEVTVRSEGCRITVRKASAGPPSARSASVSPSASGAAPQIPASFAEAPPPDLDRPTRTEALITAPLVGIFHHAEPPVGPGMTVEPDMVVGMIESMKLMNDVRAATGGKVVEVLVEAGMAVEFGQPLFSLSEGDD